MTEKPHLFLWFGDDTFTLERKLSRYREEFCKRHQDTNLTTVAGDECTGKALIAEAQAMPFLAEKRMIIVQNFLALASAEEQTIVAQHLADIPESTIVLFIERETPDRRTVLFKALSKDGTVEMFETPQPEEIQRFLKQEAARLGTELGDEPALYLASCLGPDLWQLTSALEKLSLYVGKRPIGITDIDALVEANVTASIFRFTDALSERNAALALKTLTMLASSGEDLMRIFYMIVRHLRLLIQVFDGILRHATMSDLLRDLRQPPFVIQNLMRSAKNFQWETLQDMYKKLLQIDIGVKTGKIRLLVGDNREFMLAIERWIVELCREKIAMPIQHR